MCMHTATGRPNSASIGVPENSLQLTRRGHCITFYFLMHIYEKNIVIVYHEMLTDLHVFSTLE